MLFCPAAFEEGLVVIFRRFWEGSAWYVVDTVCAVAETVSFRVEPRAEGSVVESGPFREIASSDFVLEYVLFYLLLGNCVVIDDLVAFFHLQIFLGFLSFPFLRDCAKCDG